MVPPSSGDVGVRVTVLKSPEKLSVVGTTVCVLWVCSQTLEVLMSTGSIASLKVIDVIVGTPVVVTLFAGTVDATVGLVKSKDVPVVKVLVTGVIALPLKSVTPVML